MSDTSNWLFGTVLVLFGAVWFSPDALLVKLTDCSALDTVLYRMSYFGLSACIGGYCYMLYERSGSHNEAVDGAIEAFVAMGWPFPALGVCAVYCPCIVFFVFALAYTTAANALVLIGLSPLWSAGISWLVLQEPLRRVTLATLLVSVACVVSMFLFDTDKDKVSGASSWKGDCMALGTSVGLACYFVGIRLGQRYNNARSFLPLLPFNCIVIVAVCLAAGARYENVTGLDHLWVFLQGGIVAPVSIAAWTVGPQYISAPECSLYQLIEMVLGPFFVWVALGEVPSAVTCIAGSVILIVMTMHSWVMLRELGGEAPEEETSGGAPALQERKEEAAMAAAAPPAAPGGRTCWAASVV